MRTLAVGLAAAVLAGCVTEKPAPATGHATRACGFTGPTWNGGVLTEHPVRLEGGPFVGIATEERDPEYAWSQRFSLVNCSTRQIVRIEAQVLQDVPLSQQNVLLADIDRLRREGRLTRTGQIKRLGMERGWTWIEGAAPAASGRVDCACALLNQR